VAGALSTALQELKESKDTFQLSFMVFLFFFVPRSCHVDQFTFHISLPSLKYTIFIHLSLYITTQYVTYFVIWL